MKHMWVAPFLVAVLAADIGYAADFYRPNFTGLTTGKTSISEAIALLGEPSNRGPGDDPATTILIYNYTIKSSSDAPNANQLVVVLIFDSAGLLQDQRYYQHTG